MDVLIGLAALGLVVWYIYKKVGVAADVNNDGKVDAEDAKVGMDMAVGAIGGMATGAAVAAATAVETKVEEVVAVVQEAVEEKVEETVTVVEKAVDNVVEEVEEVVEKVKKGRKPNAK
jgi:predicted PP-loop superfamily ATPase